MLGSGCQVEDIYQQVDRYSCCQCGGQLGEKPDGHETIWCGNHICGGRG